MDHGNGRPDASTGGGQPLLLIHGFGNTWRVWEPLLPSLEPSFDVLVPTLLGHFEGVPLPEGVAPGIGSLADGLELELDSAGWDSAHIVGNSMGGWLALELAKRGRARSLVLLAPAGGWRGGRLPKPFAALFRFGRLVGRPLLPFSDGLARSSLMRRLWFGMIYAHPERFDPALAAYLFRAGIDFPAFGPLLRAITRDSALDGRPVSCPVLLAWPERDRTLPFRRYGRPHRSALPQAELRMLPDVGHVPMLDDPAAIAALIRGFVEGAAPTARAAHSDVAY